MKKMHNTYCRGLAGTPPTGDGYSAICCVEIGIVVWADREHGLVMCLSHDEAIASRNHRSSIDNFNRERRTWRGHTPNRGEIAAHALT